jgi:glutathione S-transferase
MCGTGKDGWSQTGDWLAELRDDSRTEPPGDDQSKADRADVPWSEALAQADVHAEANARAGATERAVIGDQLRTPVM